MSIIIKPPIRGLVDLPYHKDNAPGQRYVFTERSLYPESEFYIIGRRVEDVPRNQVEYIEPHRHNCNSFYFFIGDGENLDGLEARVRIEGNEFFAESPSTVMIPEHYSHDYKLNKGQGWFFHVVLSRSYCESVIGERDMPGMIIKDISQFYKGFEKQPLRPSDVERPIEWGDEGLKNPQRYKLVDKDIFEKAGIYATMHEIFSDREFDLRQKLHSNYEDEVYIFFTRAEESLSANIFSSDDEKNEVEAPLAVYHPKNAKHRYDYVSGNGFLLVVLKERIPGEGYTFKV